MLRSFHAELQKAHRRHDLLLCLLVPLIMILWVGGLAPSDPEELANGYSALLYSIPVIEAILMPVLMAVLASRLWEIEVKGSMPKFLYTLQERRSLFAGKAAFGLLEILLVTLLETGAAVLLGIVHGYTEAFPTGQLVYLFVCTLAVDAMLFFGEFLLMLWVGNPLPALCVGIVGALVGLFSAFMPPLASYFVPFGYYIPLSAYEVANWDMATHTVTYGTRPFNWGCWPSPLRWALCCLPLRGARYRTRRYKTMLKRCILAENRKLHASPIWAMFFVLPVLSATYGTFNYLQNLEILTDGWYSLWTQHTLFYSMLFFPAMVATYAAYLWRLEHLGHNWNLIMASPVRPMDLFAAKFVVVTKLALLTHGFVFALFVFCGKVFAHLPGLPPVTLPLFLLRGLLGALAVIAAQLVLAMVIRSFAVPIFLGLLGGILGIFAGSKGFSLLWPYALMQAGMNANKSEDALAGSYGMFFLSCAFWLAAMFLLAWGLLRKRDVKA